MKLNTKTPITAPMIDGITAISKILGPNVLKKGIYAPIQAPTSPAIAASPAPPLILPASSEFRMLPQIIAIITVRINPLISSSSNNIRIRIFYFENLIKKHYGTN